MFMIENSPDLQLISVGEHEWRFLESPAMQNVTLKFDAIWERYQGEKNLGTPLKKFLSENPNHVDGLHHYAMHRIYAGHLLDGYVYALAAVTTARAVFPQEFQQGLDRIPYGFVSNRPFHRAINGLMFAHASMRDIKAAIRCANEQLDLDSEDRMGVRMILASYLLEDGQPQAALKILSFLEKRDLLFTTCYLKAIALFCLGKADEGKALLKVCLSSYPHVARYILNATAPAPVADTRFGIECHSEYEGWFYGCQYAPLWRQSPEAMNSLRELSEPIAAAGWKRSGSR